MLSLIAAPLARVASPRSRSFASRCASLFALLVVALALFVGLGREARAQSFYSLHNQTLSVTTSGSTGTTHTISYYDKAYFYNVPSPGYGRMLLTLWADVYTISGTYKGSALIEQRWDTVSGGNFTPINSGAFREGGGTKVITSAASTIKTLYNQQNPPLPAGSYKFHYVLQSTTTVTSNFSLLFNSGATRHDSNQFVFTSLF